MKFKPAPMKSCSPQICFSNIKSQSNYNCIYSAIMPPHYCTPIKSYSVEVFHPNYEWAKRTKFIITVICRTYFDTTFIRVFNLCYQDLESISLIFIITLTEMEIVNSDSFLHRKDPVQIRSNQRLAKLLYGRLPR